MHSPISASVHHAVILMSTVSCSLAAQRGYVPRMVTVQSCPVADSVLGPLRQDHRAQVRGYFAADRNRASLQTGPLNLGSAPYLFQFQMEYPGRGPLDVQDARVVAAGTYLLQLYVRGQQGRDLLQAGSLPPVTIAVNDSVPVQPAGAHLGSFAGPSQIAMAPVWFEMTYDQLLQLARARRVEVRLGENRYRMTGDQRRDVRALIVFALCSAID